MKNYLAIALVTLCALSTATLFGQGAEDDDVFELSPFSVSANRYRSTSSLAGVKTSASTEIGAAYNDLGSTIAGLTGASDAQFGEARAVSVEFAIGFYDDSEKTRRLTLSRHLRTIEEAVASSADFHFEPGALLIARGDRKRLKGQRRSTLTSYAHFSVLFELKPGVSPFKRVKAIRDLIAGLELESDVTKLFFGDANLDMESPFHSLAAQSGAHVFRGGISRTSDLGATLSYLTDRMHRAVATSEPQSPISIIKPIDAISVSFAIDYRSDLEDERKAALLNYLNQIEAKANETPGVQFEPGSLLLRHGDRAGQMAMGPSSFIAQAQFRLNIDFSDGSLPDDSVRQVRALVNSIEIDPEKAALRFGTAHPIFDQPERFRGELLAAIFKDLAEMKSHLGERYDLEPKIANSRILLKQRSATEVELWIPYDYKIVSHADREREEANLVRAHELALAQSQCCAAACCAKRD